MVVLLIRTGDSHLILAGITLMFICLFHVSLPGVTRTGNYGEDGRHIHILPVLSNPIRSLAVTDWAYGSL